MSGEAGWLKLNQLLETIVAVCVSVSGVSGVCFLVLWSL